MPIISILPNPEVPSREDLLVEVAGWLLNAYHEENSTLEWQARLIEQDGLPDDWRHTDGAALEWLQEKIRMLQTLEKFLLAGCWNLPSPLHSQGSVV